jgi:uncharacterized protein (DUF305 family)
MVNWFPAARTTTVPLLKAVATALAATLVCSACSGEGATPPAPTATSPTAPVIQPGKPGAPNTSLTGSAALPSATAAPKAADVAFMQDMIVHHAQAIVMVDLVKDQLTDTQVRALSARIADEQRPEIDAMARWLEAKGQKVPPQAKNPQFGANDTHHAGMPGMASKAQLTELSKARGAAADQLWLKLMVAHHAGALRMVLDQHRDGIDEVVTQMGDEIHVTQSVQIGQMREMQDRLA